MANTIQNENSRHAKSTAYYITEAMFVVPLILLIYFAIKNARKIISAVKEFFMGDTNPLPDPDPLVMARMWTWQALRESHKVLVATAQESGVEIADFNFASAEADYLAMRDAGANGRMNKVQEWKNICEHLSAAFKMTTAALQEKIKEKKTAKEGAKEE